MVESEEKLIMNLMIELLENWMGEERKRQIYRTLMLVGI